LRIALAALLLIGTSAAALRAQDRTDIAQIPQATTADPVAPAEPVQASGDAPAQISAAQDSGPEQAQLTSVGTSRDEPSQVAKRSRNPAPPDPLSTPEQGRTAAIDPVTGHDHCDPANGSEKGTLKCKRVIENRAAEYRRPAPTELSPEQKLMIDQQLRAEESASQRLAQSGNPANNLDSMGIASVVLNQQGKGDEDKKAKQDEQSQAAVQALVTILQSTPPPN
jgi:hypothetical protein